jgi:hypothetical protein
MLQQDGMVMVKMKVLVMEMMMMIPMKSGAMVMTMAMISPFREPRQISACLRAFLSLVFSTLQRRRCLPLSPLDLGFWDDEIREGAMAEVG